ncbi:MAG: metal-dependent hydrolase [Leptolyngbyaceae cyanobacterium SL_1_1]|nr:metal-dependent hydrolase [Leptolyngbyaceae cyanobacterium SL_1_1]
MRQYFSWAGWLGAIAVGALAVVILGLPATSPAQSSGTELLWYGQSAFKLTTPTGKVLLIDPWLQNPLNTNGDADLANLTEADLILITHGHGDHVGNAFEIAEKTQAKLVSTADLGKALIEAGYPEDLVGRDTQGNFGGELTLLEGEVKVAFIPAVHSSAIGTDGNPAAYAGNPGGFLITVENGPVIYHTGDTDLFSDISLVSQFRPVDIMLTCIGDQFTMGTVRAAEAVKRVNPKTAVPMHYGVFTLTGTPAEFEAALDDLDVPTEYKLMSVGEPVAL